MNHYKNEEATPVAEVEKKPLTLEEKWKLLIDVVLRDAIAEAEVKLPQEGFFPRIKIGLVYPGDEEIYGLLNLEPGSDKAGRVAHVGAYRHGTYRLVSNFVCNSRLTKIPPYPG